MNTKIKSFSTMRKILLVTLGGIAIFFLWRDATILEQMGLLNSQRTSDDTSQAVIAAKEQIDQSRRRPLDPFMDLTFSQDEISLRYSSHHCVATGTRNPEEQVDPHRGRRPNWVSRTCLFRNLYYRINDQTFHYFASPIETLAWNAAREMNNSDSYMELMQRMETSIGGVDDMASPEMLKKFNLEPWKPISHEESSELPATSLYSVAGPANTAFLLYQPYHGFNFGHFMWDDLLALFSMMDLFDLAESTMPVPFFVENRQKNLGYGGHDPLWRCGPANWRKWVKCVKAYKRWFPALFGIQPDCSGDILRTGNWLLGENMIGTWPTQDKQVCHNNRTNLPPQNSLWVVLPQVTVGTGRLMHSGCVGDCSIGRGHQFYRFRTFLLQNLFGDVQGRLLAKQAPKGYITFSLAKNSSRPDHVYNFQEEIGAAKERFGEDVVKVISMADYDLQEQAHIAMDSAVFITNHGGGSASSIFVQKNTGVFIFWHQGIRHDYPFYESSLFRTTWFSINDRPYLNRSMALLDAEIERTARDWPKIACYQRNRQQKHRHN